MIAGLGHGQVWWADMDKVRPVVVLTRSGIAERLSRVVIAPVTGVVRDIPTEIPIGTEAGVADGSVVNVDNVQLVPVDRLLGRAGTIPEERWTEVCAAVAHMMGCSRAVQTLPSGWSPMR